MFKFPKFVLSDENQSSSPFTATINFDNNFTCDYEDPNDSNFDNNYSFRVRAYETNNTTIYDEIYIDILITDQDEAPVIVKPDPVDLDNMIHIPPKLHDILCSSSATYLHI